MSYSCIYITYIEAYGPVLKIWGQTEPTTPISIEKALSNMIPQFEQGHFMATRENLRVDQVVCAKYKDGLYYRATITNTSHLHDGMLEVRFMDYGNTDIISYLHVRTLSQHSPGLLTIPPQAQSFILAYVTHLGHCWEPHTITCINNDLRYVTLQYLQIAQIGSNRLIHLIRDNEDIGTLFVKRGLVTPISLQVQQLFIEDYNKKLALSPMHRMMPSPSGFPVSPIMRTQNPIIQTSSPVMQQQPAMQNEPIVLVYKSFTVEPYSTHAVYVSYVLDGPCQFSVQLKSMEEKLARLMSEINSMPLVPLDEIPLPGKVCLARCEEDDHICRAVVTSQVDNKYKIFFVDFGNTEVLRLEDLYEIPHSKILPKVMALRYALAGIERSTVTMEMKYAFKNFVSDKLLTMRAIPPLTRSSLPTCELWDEKNVSVLDVIKRAAMNSYPEPLILNRGFNQEVHVSYVYSCKQFFVQLKSKEEELNKLMVDLQESCHNNPQSLPLNMIKKGTPCCALFNVDNQWYRAQILDVDQANVKVRYVDYGNESTVPIGNLKVLPSKHILALRPQAIECCLNGYQNMTPDPARDNFLEEIILEKDFYMKVVEMIGTCVLVELIDSDKYNVASLLLDKIAASTSLISPLLVQDGNRVDHRKNLNPFQGQFSPKDHNFRHDRKPLRDQNAKAWEDKSANYENRNRSFRSDSSSEENKVDFRNRGYRQNFNRQPENERPDFNNRNEGGNSRSFGRNEGSRFFNRFDGKRDFDRNRNEGRRDFDKNEGRRDFDRSDNRRDNRKDFNRFDGKRDFNRNETDKGDFNKRDANKHFGNRDFRNDNNRDFPKKDSRPSYNREKSWSSDGSKKNSRKDGSEKSWSDHSDKSFKKSPRFGNSNKGRFSKNFNNRNNFSSSSKPDFKSQDEFEESFDVAPADAVYKTLDLTGQTKAVSISWFHNPSYFYCQLNESQEQFRSMMEEIQKIYPKRKPADMKTGAPVISLFPEDGVFYRGRVMQAQFSQFRVQYVDFGNFCTVDKVWPIDNKFMELPTQAFCCGLSLNPLDGKWPQPDMFCSYFEKDEFVCSFLSKVDNKYIVDLIHDGNNVGQSVIEAGLAVSAESSVADVDISILIRQQIRACIANVKGLDDFKIEVQKGCFVPAAMHNLSTATETFEDNLKNLVDTFVIVYVDQIVDNRLEVTLYDLQGYKIEILKPDEGAIDSVWTLCGLPVFNSSIHGYVSWVASTSVFIQPSGFEDTIAQLLESLYQYYSTAEMECVKEPVEGSIYAVHSSDSNWYRGSAMTIENETVTVMYLDYGNTETVASSELRELLPEFTELHTLAIEVFIKEDPSKYQDKELSVKLTNTEEGWMGEIEQVFEQEEQQIVEEEIIHSEEPKDIVASEEQQPESIPATETLEINLQNGIAVAISHIDSPSEFYVQLKSDLNIIESLQETIQQQIDSFPELENATAGVLCAAPYSLDSHWYRAQVLDADTDITTVRFVDFGNTDVLNNTSTHIKTLPSDLLALEQHARRCSLAIKPVEEDWSLTAHQRFESLAYEDESLQAEIIHQDEKTTYVELFVKNKSIAEVLIEEGLATKLELEVENNLTGFVSHLNSPSEFWIQLESSVADLEWIADQLSLANTFPELEDLAPGSLCAAIYSEDEQWYRARILSNTVAGIEVLFIDYGNSCTCSSLRELPEELIMLPALAQKCTLKKPPGVEQWTPQAADKFKEISADGVTIFKVQKITTGETSEVELLLNGEDVSLMLLPKTVDGVVTKVDSLDLMWILKEDDKDPIECKLEPLAGQSWAETAIDKFNELMNKGNTVFQVEFLCDGVVRLYHNGHDVRYDLDTIKISSSVTNTPKRNYVDPCISETVTELFNNAMNDVEKSENEKNLEDTIIVEEILNEITEAVEPNAAVEKSDASSKQLKNVEEVQKNDTGDENTVIETFSEELVGNKNAGVKIDGILSKQSENVQDENSAHKMENNKENAVIETFAQELVVEFNSRMQVIEKQEDSEKENVIDKNDITKCDGEESLEEVKDKNIVESNEQNKKDLKSHELVVADEKETCDISNSSSVEEAFVKPVLIHSAAESNTYSPFHHTHSTPKSDDLTYTNSNSFLNRPSSACKRYNNDEKIVPGAIVRPHSPESYFSINDDTSVNCDATFKEVKEEYFSICDFETEKRNSVNNSITESSLAKYIKISKDDRIVPGAISSPQINREEISDVEYDETIAEEPVTSLVKKLDFSIDELLESNKEELDDINSDVETELSEKEMFTDASVESETTNQNSSPYFTSMAFLKLESVKSKDTSAVENEEDTESPK